jgi:FAD/FMN-containing dehydrogenase
MKLAASEKWSVMPSGAGTWLGAGNHSNQVDLILSTKRLRGVVEHEPADLVASATSGVTLAAFNETLNRGGQWLPLDPPDDGRATLGGVVATASSGAQQTGYGTPRTFVIGMKVVLADGRTCKAGGRVVKNVAGYDLCKLFTGSFGTLGIISEVTFKLRPRPAREATIITRGPLPTVFAAGKVVYHAGLFPVAIELLSSNLANRSATATSPSEAQLLIRFAGSEKTVEHQIARTTGLLSGSTLQDIEIVADDNALWRDLQLAPLENTLGLSCRVSVKPSQVQGMMETIIEHTNQETIWHAGVADGRIRVMQSDKNTANSNTLGVLRVAAESLGGSLIIEHAAPELGLEIDAWRKLAASNLMTKIRQQLDPVGLFSPGRL